MPFIQKRIRDELEQEQDSSRQRKVTFKKLARNKTAAILKLMQEHLRKAGTETSIDVREREREVDQSFLLTVSHSAGLPV